LAQWPNRRLAFASRIAYKYDHYGHIGAPAVKELQLKDAKASLSAVVDDAVRGTPSIITRHGKPEAIVLGMKDWERLSRVPSLARLLMAAPIGKGDLPRRSKSPMRRFGG
jgi:prevent-host-death family protein